MRDHDEKYAHHVRVAIRTNIDELKGFGFLAQASARAD